MEALAQSWLSLQCKAIAGVSKALVLMGSASSRRFTPAAFWPEGARHTPALSAAAKAAITKRHPILRRSEPSADKDAPSHDYLAFPILVAKQLLGVVVLEVSTRPSAEYRTVLQLLQLNAAWLATLLRDRGEDKRKHLVMVVELVAAALEPPRFQAAATAVVTELASRLDCERVNLGLFDGKHSKIRAISHSARFGEKTNLVGDIEAAMDEALDQECTLVLPPSSGAAIRVTRAHAELSRRHGPRALCTIPLSHHGNILGALTFERPADKPFEPVNVELCEHLAALLGPILALKELNDRSLARKIWDALKRQVSDLIGPRHSIKKLGFGFIAVLLTFLVLAGGAFRVTANANLEGSVQRVVVAPMDGYIAQASARAGDIVEANAILGALDDKDLKLERLKWLSQREQLEKEYRSALAAHDRAQVRILNAQIGQAKAQLELLDAQLARIQMIAPFDGIVVSGDLSQSLGSPVERGDVMFEVAPLDAYRIALQVDERDIAYVKPSQPGRLALAGIPGRTFPFTVERITPVSTVENGRNHFRVEARLDEVSERLRPGMEGVGKIDIEHRKLVWIWTHRLVDWLRLWVWSWSP